MSQELRDMIREVIESTVRQIVAETVAETLGGAIGATRLVGKGDGTKPIPWTDAAFTGTAPEAETVAQTRARVAKRARQSGPRVEYTVATVSNRSMAELLRVKAAGLVGNDAIVFKLLAKGKPRTMPAVQQALDMKAKAVESSLHQLRVAGLIQSQPIEGR